MTDETKCPKCQSTNRAEILYGLVKDKALKEELKQKGIVLGGCKGVSRWQCNECRTKWGKRD